ncbi:Hypothetical predicted protein, partial [Podarcis lilfordi]
TLGGTIAGDKRETEQGCQPWNNCAENAHGSHTSVTLEQSSCPEQRTVTLEIKGLLSHNRTAVSAAISG